MLKDYLIKGCAVNEKSLKGLEKTIELIDIATRLEDKNAKVLDLLDDYDYKTIKGKGTNKSLEKIDYEEGMNVINTIRFNNHFFYELILPKTLNFS